MISSRPAEAVGLGKEIGSLAAGRRGDVVIWSGDPLELELGAGSGVDRRGAPAARQSPDQASRPLSLARAQGTAGGLSQMTGMGMLVMASLAFVGTHFLMSHPLRTRDGRRARRAGLRRRLFAGLVADLRLDDLGLSRRFGRGAAAAVGRGARWDLIVATVLMWLGSVLFVGSLRRNPGFPAARQDDRADRRPERRLCDHPPSDDVGFRAVGSDPCDRQSDAGQPDPVLRHRLPRLVGAALQDEKKARLLGDVWRDWRSKTSFVPYGRGLKSADGFALLVGTIALAGGNLGAWSAGLPAGGSLGLFRLSHIALRPSAYGT